MRGGRGGGGEVWFRTLLETLEKAGKSTALAVAHFLDALIQLTRSGNTKSLRNAFGNSMHNRPIAAPPLGIHREGHNRRHMLGADQGAAAQVDDVDISSGNQTQCSQRFLARDTPTPCFWGRTATGETCCIRRNAVFLRLLGLRLGL